MKSILAIPQDLTAAMVSTSGLTGGAIANVVNNRVGQVARWSAAVGNKVIDIDLGSAKSIDVVAALWSNLRSTDSWSIQAGTTLGGSEVYSSGSIGAYYSTNKVTSAGTKSMKVLANPVTARYWRITLTVNTSVLPEGYTELSRIVLGSRQIYDVDYSSIDIMPDDRGGVDQSDYGEDIEDVRRISFGMRLRWRFGSQAEMLASHRLLMMRGTTKPLLFAPIPANESADAQDLLAFGKLRTPARTVSSAFDIWEVNFEIYSDAA